MTCHNTKDNVELYRFIPDYNSRLFSFLYIVFYWNNNLKLCFNLADTAVTDFLKSC